MNKNNNNNSLNTTVSSSGDNNNHFPTSSEVIDMSAFSNGQNPSERFLKSKISFFDPQRTKKPTPEELEEGRQLAYPYMTTEEIKKHEELIEAAKNANII